ncbi:MAG: enolase C-terminal domain-like protein [Rhodoglobus sp.]
MKITSVEVVLVRAPGVTPPFRWRNGLPGSEPEHTAGWLVITTDTGLTGYAYHKRGAIVQDIVMRRISAELVGRSVLERELIWQRLWEIDRVEEFPIYIIGLVDEALWDIAGKSAGLPVHELIGTFRTSVPAYASTVTFRDIPQYLDVADQCLDRGFKAIKLHAWGDAKKDARLALALRESVGPDVELMFDGSAGFDLMDAVYLGKALEEAGYLWYEEPMREFSVTAYRWLGERVRVPLLVAETSDGAHMNSADFIASGCASAVRISSTFRAGITGSLRTAHLAESFLLRAEVHGGGLPAIQLCMSVPNNTYYECLVDDDPIGPALEVDENGDVHAPVGPGMGYEAEWETTGTGPNQWAIV